MSRGPWRHHVKVPPRVARSKRAAAAKAHADALTRHFTPGRRILDAAEADRDAQRWQQQGELAVKIEMERRLVAYFARMHPAVA